MTAGVEPTRLLSAETTSPVGRVPSPQVTAPRWPFQFGLTTT
jgi:hypothetical protein